MYLTEFPSAGEICSNARKSSRKESYIYIHALTLDLDRASIFTTHPPHEGEMSSESVNKDAKAGGISPNGETIPVIIAGAGPVGLLLALLLARKGIASKVFERGSEVDTSPRAAVYYPLVL
ncbi:hypothetical protein ACJQWK_00040 [Exserohilum turcicum]